MARVSVSRRATSGVVLIVAGALFLVAVLLPLTGISLPWLLGIAFAVVAIALGILGLGAVNNTIAKVTLVAAALGWLVLAISSLGVGIAIPALLGTVGALVAGIGALVGAIVILVGREVANGSALAFVIATVLGLVFLLGLIGTLALGQAGTVVAALFGLALVVTGVLFRMRERRRR